MKFAEILYLGQNLLISEELIYSKSYPNNSYKSEYSEVLFSGILCLISLSKIYAILLTRNSLRSKKNIKLKMKKEKVLFQGNI